MPCGTVRLISSWLVNRVRGTDKAWWLRIKIHHSSSLHRSKHKPEVSMFVILVTFERPGQPTWVSTPLTIKLVAVTTGFLFLTTT